MSFEQISLAVLVKKIGEDTTETVLSDFICNTNLEVQDYLHNKAIKHEKRGISKTVLITDTKTGAIVGYYSITTKSFILSEKINSNAKKRLFGTSQTNGNIIPAILIGQLGKNENVISDFTGKDLMSFIFRYIKKMSELTPSVIVYVEHDGRESLIKYYEQAGFKPFKREKEETEQGLYCHIIKTKDILDLLNCD